MTVAVGDFGFAAGAHGERVIGQFPGINRLPIAVIDDRGESRRHFARRVGARLLGEHHFHAGIADLKAFEN